jgi:hypothetical protein
MVQVDAGIDSFKGGIDGVSFLISAYNIVAHVQWYDLLVVEDVLDNNDRTARTVNSQLFAVGILFLLCLTKLTDSNAYAKLLATLVTLEYQ